MKRLIGVVMAGLCGVAMGAVGVGPADAAGRWSVVTLPSPADAASNPGVILGVGACGSPGQCVIPGGYQSAHNGGLGLIVTVSDGVATTQSLPAPAGAPADPREALTKAACLSSGPCVAVGNYEVAGGPLAGVLASQSGSDWQLIAAPAPSGATARIFDVACAGDVCFAVGDIGIGRKPLVERYANGEWSYTVLKAPAGEAANNHGLQTVSCSSATRCVAAGTSSTSQGYGPPLGATWNGSSWKTATLPEPADTSRSFVNNTDQVSACAADGTCHALANYRPKGVHLRPADYANDGTHWTATGLPDENPPVTNYLYVNAISCRAADSCIAVGVEESSQSDDGVIFTLTAAGWSLTNAPPPGSGSGAVALTALDCLPGGACTAFGLGNFTGSPNTPIATTTTGTPSTTKLPRPAGFQTIKGLPTAVYDGTRQLVAGYYYGTSGQVGALWMRTV